VRQSPLSGFYRQTRGLSGTRSMAHHGEIDHGVHGLMDMAADVSHCRSGPDHCRVEERRGER